MNRDEFWTLIEEGHEADEPAALVRRELEHLTAEELIAYQNHFEQLFADAYRWDLWGAAYIIESGCSDDGFTDFRYALISRGRAAYEAALKDPDSLADANIVSDELFGYVAFDVYSDKTGTEMPRNSRLQPKMPIGEEWNFDDATENRRRLPRLWEKHGW
jgi:hypothetical protein